MEAFGVLNAKAISWSVALSIKRYAQTDLITYYDITSSLAEIVGALAKS